MEAPELEKWLDHHIAAYPSVRDFIAREKGTKAIWFQVMQDCRMKDAIRVSTQMVKGLLEAPRGFGDHPRFVRKHAKLMEAAEPRSERRKGPPCGLCGGSGGVFVWTEIAHKRMREGWDQASGRYKGWDNTTSCACKCSKGEKYRKYSAEYNDQRHVLRISGVSGAVESIQALRDFESAADTVPIEGGGDGQQWTFPGDEK